MDCEVAVIGAGVVGTATALALARRGVSTVVLEAEREPGLAASGTNSGILHTGFDSVPGELETRLIIRSGELRDRVLEALGVPVDRCGARLGPGEAVAGLATRAAQNGVAVSMREDGILEVPGEAVTDPIAYTSGLMSAACRQGGSLRAGFTVAALRPELDGLIVESAGGERLRAAKVVNCAGLHADEIARLAGDDSFEIYPRKGEFLVFEPPPEEILDRILLPVPTKRTKGVLVFPTIDGKVIAGPTAIDHVDKDDWSVRPAASAEILPQAIVLWPPLEEATQISEYAGLRPAGRGVNYLIERSRACDSLVNVAAIRSTGLTASLAIAEHVCGILQGMGVSLGSARPLEKAAVPRVDTPWWRRVAEYRSS
jgi:glycerol-3-phosphate dehydrogenase